MCCFSKTCCKVICLMKFSFKSSQVYVLGYEKLKYSVGKKFHSKIWIIIGLIIIQESSQ